MRQDPSTDLFHDAPHNPSLLLNGACNEHPFDADLDQIVGAGKA